MSFPDRRFEHVGEYADAYFAKVQAAAASVDRAALQKAAEILIRVHRGGGTVFACGNGGSAGIANHLVCDHCKLVQSDTDLTPRIWSLSLSPELMTAISNDLSYEEVFVYQLRSMARPGDVLVSVSSSGDSENIVRAVSWATEHEVATVAMTGFSGGRSAELAEVKLHVASDNYGVIEDVHHSLMHVLAQFLRQAHMDEGLVQSVTF